jgi:Na+-transporting NADH:ubiquinone oxidoreductase subunit C
MPSTNDNKGFLTRFKELPVDSTPKTIAVAVGLCLFCSMVVSSVAVALKPVQEYNKVLDKRRNILQVAGLYDASVDVDEAFKSIESRLINIETGEFTEAFDPVEYDQRAAAKDPALSTELTFDPAGIGRQADVAAVYLIRDDAGQIDKVILPIHGYGLWSTLYGFIALEEDGDEVFGLQFYEHGETPGLGAEVDNPRWRASWNGKQVYGDDGDVQITVSKAIPNADNAKYHIDALAGATLTSRGVDNLVKFWMGDDGFKPFLEKLRSGEIS